MFQDEYSVRKHVNNVEITSPDHFFDQKPAVKFSLTLIEIQFLKLNILGAKSFWRQVCSYGVQDQPRSKEKCGSGI